ncbi:unnamed protein product, partial [Porites evermanni]
MTPLHPSLTFHLIFVSVAAGLNNCIAVTSIKDYSLTNHIYKISSGKSQLTCIVACDQDTKCYSLNYRFPSKTCELSNSTRFADLQDFLFSPDVVYFDHLSRPSGSCVGDAPCKNNGRCFNLAKAPGFKCKCYKDYTGETCNVCSSPPLGMRDRRILDHQITASSVGMSLSLKRFNARDARLWLKSSSWVSALVDYSPWLQITFAPEIKLITGIATQGSPLYDWFITSYTLKYSMTGKIWKNYEQGGLIKVCNA